MSIYTTIRHQVYQNIKHTMHCNDLDEVQIFLLTKFHEHKTSYTRGETEEMKIALCAFLHLELKLIMRVKHFLKYQVHTLTTPENDALAATIREEFPIQTFNALLMEFFDATMASSEGNVTQVTELTRDMFKQIKKWLWIIRPNVASYSK